MRLVMAVGIAVSVMMWAYDAEAGEWTEGPTITVDQVWSGHPVGFAFATRDGRQYVGYYDARRRMVFAQRDLDGDTWDRHVTSERVGWDSHNVIRMAFDRDGCIHVSANMHCVPLNYWRSEKPADVTTLKALHRMVGRNERACTYPQFFHLPDGRLIFMYREGGSGNGRRFVNIYDPKARTWRRHFDTPLFEGQGRMNAYPISIRQDREKVFHVAWVWRNTPNCATNHDVSYARSRDFRTWTKSDGTPLRLPITVERGEVVDPIRAGAGLINWGDLRFDPKGRPIIAYIKFDTAGKTQLYGARREATGWRIYQLTEWTHRWAFSGGGSIVPRIMWTAPFPAPGGKALQFRFRHWKYGPGWFAQRVDAETLKPVGEPTPVKEQHEALRRVRSDVPGMQVHLHGSPVVVRDGRRMRYLLRWETLGPNRDRPRAAAPPPSTLQVVELVWKPSS